MPYSDPRFDNKILDFLKQNKSGNYLDIGPGAGKYGKMIRSITHTASILAVEAESSYIDLFNLKEIYDEVINMRIEDFVRENPGFSTDIVIIGDCLEHLPKSNGLDLIHYLMYRSRFIIITFPSKYIQYDWDGVSSEAHYSVWSREDFLPFKHQYFNQHYMNLVILNGFLSDPESIYPPTPEEVKAANS